MKRLTMLLLAVAALLVSAPATASAKIPADPRVTAAVAAWKSQPLYVDPQYASVVGDQGPSMIERIRQSNLPVFVAVLPTGSWFQERGDIEMLAGWLAHANGKPGIYLVMDGDRTFGAEHLVRAYGPSYTYSARDESMSQQLSVFLDRIRERDGYEPKAARTQPLPPPEERVRPRERFTAGKAIGNGAGGLIIGLMGGALLAGCVLGLAAVVARRGGGRL
ncbi:hypothetical protein [Kribbella sp. CA-293567]|uniref:hypothetical protein n=1 Tax=Kribbella sp. CA-293567 TaxID=3002436 RepID=UPI0022DE5319|nr:hypothetical protein [Kribbella sp. CA-293567]WBQ05753.1 hypothetical protein OX958_02865 [Kribbella sp. CA-293567]